MSNSTLQAIWPGEKHENVVQYGNSWGTAPLVWDTFCERHLRLEKHWWMFNAEKKPNLLWDAWRETSIPESHRAVLLFTMDNLYVVKMDYRRFGKDLRQFLEDTTISANVFNHWPSIAQRFEMEPDYPAMALWCTSVTSDPWYGPYNEGTEDYDPFDWSRAYDLYTELDGVRDEEKQKAL